MNKPLHTFLLRLFCATLLLLPVSGAYASHIIGMDLNYTHVSDSTYKITLVVYGDCAGSAFSTLPTATPTICVYDGDTSVTSVTMAIDSPSAGIEITPVCAADSNQTTCTNLSNPVAGIKRFVYSVTYTLPHKSQYWRFIFAGKMSNTSVAGRSSSITNINSPGTSIIELVDTLNDMEYSNSNPQLTVLPTPYYCLNKPANYNPGAVDPDGDVLRFTLIPGLNNGPNGLCSTAGAAAQVSYIAAHSGSFPIQTPTGTFAFSASAGQISFTPDTIQKALVVYNIEEFRNDTLIGTSQREMVYTVVECTTPPPSGYISGITNGTIDDSTDMHICAQTGTFSFTVQGFADDTTNLIHMTSSGLPSGSTFVLSNDSTNHASGTFSWTSTGVTPGVYTFYVTFNDNACPLAGSATRAFSITIKPQPNADTIHGLSSVCVSSSITMVDTASGGIWSSSFPSIATITSGGILTGAFAGTDTIKYTVTNSCNTAVATKLITVKPLPNAGVITGPTEVCSGSSISLADTTSGGYWTSSNTTASVSASGVVTGGTIAGIDTIKYTDTNSCGTAVASRVITILPLPNAGTISGPSTVCVGGSITLTDTASGGVWSRQNLNATVDGTSGVVTGVTAGTDSIRYNYSNSCGTAVVSKNITIVTAPSAGVVTGPSTVCPGFTITLADTSGSGLGTWSSTNNSIAIVSSAGVVTGLAAAGGTDTIKYSLAETCGSVTASKVITVLPLPGAGVISGLSTACLGTTLTLTDTAGGGAGTWMATNSSASVAGGLVTPNSAGTDTIKYTVTNSCASISASKIITITQLASPGVVTGPSSVCVGSSITLADTASGGVWSTSSDATVTGGVVTGGSAGQDTVYYTVNNVCGAAVASKIVTVNPLPDAGVINGSSSVCLTATLTLTDTASGGTWSAANSDASVSGGVVTPAIAGTDTIKYSVTNTCGTAVASKVVTIFNLPTAGVIAGASAVCVSASIDLADGTSGGTWSASNGHATVSAGGVVTGAGAGVDTIYYTVTNTCGVATAQKVITVNPLPNAGVITGAATVCAGSTTTLSDTAAGGTWGNSTNAVATVAGGVVTGVMAGNDTVNYSVTNGCGTAVATKLITVNALPVAGTISGASSVCVGSSVTLTDTASGGVWSSSNAHASVAGGVVTGTTSGTDTITYTVTNGCGVASTSVVMNIDPLPNSGTISGPTVVCVAANITLTDTASGGTWSTSNGNASVTGGVVTGVAAGTTTVSYTSSVTCGSSSAIYNITVNPLPDAGAISGANFICVSGSATLTESVTGGTWSATNGNAVVLSSGLTGGITAGADTIQYTVTNSCGTAVASHVVTVGTAIPTSPITGATTVCAGANITLSDTTAGGAWSSGNTTVATVNSSGVVHGVNSGTATISYIVTSTCGSFVVTSPVTVNPAPHAGAISGSSSLCSGTNITLTDTASGGAWSSSNSGVASVSSGVVTGVAGGAATISYSVTNGCGTANAIKNITVNPAANAGVITGASVVCQFNSISLTDTTTGGTWSSSNAAVASVNTSGIVTGVTAGSVTISYTFTNSCGTMIATAPVTVNPAPNAGAIAGASNVCNGNTITLSDTASGGTWSSSNAGVATVDASGVVTGAGTGPVVISYSVTNSCGTATATASINVSALPSAGAISGTTTFCQASSVSLSESASGGTWSSGNSAVATVNSSGIVTGISGGTAIISYSDSTSCGTAVATAMVTINPLPVAGIINGTSAICNGSSALLTDTSANGLGTWSSSNSGFVSVDPAGNITGVASGTSVISYTVTNGCGTSTATRSVTASPAPNSGVISGAATFCQGVNTTLSETVTGGVWSSSNNLVATVSSSGVVTGVGGGTAIISYSILGGCTGATSTFPVSINPFPNAGTISGTPTVCITGATTLTDTASGGTWSSGNTSIATVSAAGVVTGVSAGVVNIYYAVSNSCGASNATISLTVSGAPSAGVISGIMSACPGGMSALSESVGGGAWSSSNPAIATIDTDGIVSAIASGTTNISYTVTSACGTTATASVFTVTSTNVGAISGTTALCPGNTSTLSETVSGGTWSSSNSSIASVSATGVVTAVTAGSATISYTVSGACGLASATVPVAVNSSATAGAILGGASLCVSTTTTLSDAVPGGTWTSSNSAVAPVSASGVVTGLTIGSATITYSVVTTCGAASTTTNIVVDTTPSEGVMIGATIICAGSTSPFTESAPGGVWSSSDTAVATVSSTGLVTGVSGGTAIISYAVITTCGTAIATADMTVKPLPNTGAITGASSVCVGTQATLSDTASGGVWSSSNAGLATVGFSGIVTGVGTGNVTITYSVTNDCGTANAVHAMTVGVPPSTAGSISGTSIICPGIADTLHDAVTGGVWSSSDTAVAVVSASGIMTGMTGGAATISYMVTNSCGSATAIYPVTINTGSSAGSISTTLTSICNGATTTLTDGVSGGTWSSSDASSASVDGSGVVTGVMPGSAVISYTVSNSCGESVATVGITVNPVPSVSLISGGSTVCMGTSVTLSNTASGGVWSSSNASVASIDATTGVVTGLSLGVTNITYTVTNAFSCSASTMMADTVKPQPEAGSISAATTTMCALTSITLMDTTSGGVWSSSDTTLAVVSPVGVVTGLAFGAPVISYSVTNSCGMASATVTVNVNPAPVVTALSGPSTICLGSTVALTEGSFGGAWTSSDNTIATVDGLGNVTGMDLGTVTITYQQTNVFGCSNMATFADTVNPSTDAGSIMATATTLCPGAVSVFTDGAAGGVWSSGDTTVATVDASGNVTAVAGGIAAISYSVSNSYGCNSSAIADVTVNPAPVNGPIAGTATICVSSSVTLTDGVFGGTWSTDDAGIATIDASTGVLTGASAGEVTVSYTVTNVFGCSTTSIAVDTVIAPPFVTPVGYVSVCAGSTAMLIDLTPAGAWSSGDTTIATVNASGEITGVAAGSVNISYTVFSGVGCSTTVSAIETVNALPVMAAITGNIGVCPGSNVTLADATPAGTWSTTDVSVATIDATTGVVAAVAPGVATISYTVTNVAGCSATVTATDTVNTIPDAGSISGPSDLCVSGTAAYTESVTGGVWSATTPSVASVDVSGNVTAGTAGTDTIMYVVTNGAGCSATTSYIINVHNYPVVDGITGATSVCPGATMAAMDDSLGGMWSSSDATIATIDASTGMITGVMAGTFTTSYSVSSFGCATTVTTSDTVLAAPVVAAITGTFNMCPSGSAMLSDATTGGTWSSSNNAVATIDASGTVTPVAPGIDTIYYTVSNAIGCATSVMAADTVSSLPDPGSISGPTNVCVANSITLTDGIGGGTWSSSDATIATIDASSGVVTGVAGGSAMMTYTVSNGIGCQNMAFAVVNVDTLPVVAAISGSSSVCLGGSVTLSDGGSGTWSSSDATIASVDAGGVVTGNLTGPATISYTVTNAAGCSTTVIAIETVTPALVVAPISGLSSACLGGTISLSDVTAGGTWGSSDTSIATVNASGMVTITGNGSAAITYTVSSAGGCSSFAATTVSTVALPASTILPAVTSATLCHGTPVVLTVNSTGGGAGLSYQWYKNGTAISGAIGMGYTVTTPGVYDVTISEGTCSDLLTAVTVLAPPAPVIVHGTGSIIYTGSFASYQWLFDGNPIPGATSSIYNATGAGIYNVVVTDGNGCSDTSAGYTVGGGSSSVPVVTNGADIRIYPNPASSQLNIDASVKVNITILGTDGKLMLRQDDAKTVDISSLPAAMYIIMVYDENNMLLRTDKFIKAE